MTGKHRDQEQDAATPGRWVIDATGIPGLDAVLGGGLPRGALVSIVGQPGSGKTVLAGQMAFAAARAGRRVVFFTALSESTYKIVAHLRRLRLLRRAGARRRCASLQYPTDSGRGS